MKRLHDAGIHIEVSAMYMKGMEEDLHLIAERINKISPHIPLQVMRFIPLGNASIEDEPSIEETENLCDSLRKKLKWVYLFNSPGTTYLSTLCPDCGAVMIEREFFGPMGSRTLNYQADQKCSCGTAMPVKGFIRESAFEEPGFFGGYRTTRAMEMIHSILACLGAEGKAQAGTLWAEIMDVNYLDRMHRTIQIPEKYCETVSFLAGRTGSEDAGLELTAYLNTVLEDVKNKVSKRKKPSVYYAMGYPLFAINAERFESNLADIAGGECVNKSIEREGKPGVTISPEEFNAFNPDYIFISGFLSCPVSDFCRYCNEKALRAEAIEREQIYQLPPSWDFGNPRWALGLMFIANILHPEICSYDIENEAERFYNKFYGTSYKNSRISRSFYNVK